MRVHNAPPSARLPAHLPSERVAALRAISVTLAAAGDAPREAGRGRHGDLEHVRTDAFRKRARPDRCLWDRQRLEGPIFRDGLARVTSRSLPDWWVD